MSPTDDTEALHARLTELAVGLHAPAVRSDPVLWAAAASLDTACLLLEAHRLGSASPADVRQALLEAVGSARAAVGATTHALCEITDRGAERFFSRPGPGLR